MHSNKKYFSVLLDVEEEGLGSELDNIKLTIYYLMFTKYVKTFHKKRGIYGSVYTIIGLIMNYLFFNGTKTYNGNVHET